MLSRGLSVDNSPCHRWYHRSTIVDMRYQRVIKHGNALAIVIPAAVCRELEIHRGDVVRLAVGEKESKGGTSSWFYLEICPMVEGVPPPETHGTK